MNFLTAYELKSFKLKFEPLNNLVKFFENNLIEK